MLAVPPVLPAIHHDLGLDEKSIGALTSLPVLMLAAAAVPGSLLVARAGPRRALIAGLLLVAAAGAARGVGPSAALLFGLTFLMGVGVAVSQPAFPSVVKDWFPARVGLATAVYANGLLVGEILPTALTQPLVLPLVRGSWEWSLAAWSLPVMVTAALIAWLVPHLSPDPDAPRARWWPDWRNPLTWRYGLIFACISALYWGTNAFIPDFLHQSRRPELVAPTLAALNAAQLPPSIVAVIWPRRLVGRRWPFLLGGAGMMAGLLGLVAMPGIWPVFWAAELGVVSGLVFVCVLALPPLLAAPADVARLSAAMFTLTYACAFLGPLAGGAAWDATGAPFTAFAPGFLGGLLMIWLALGLRLPTSARAVSQADRGQRPLS